MDLQRMFMHGRVEKAYFKIRKCIVSISKNFQTDDIIEVGHKLYHHRLLSNISIRYNTVLTVI